ncbi:response regulator [uncultured Maribacter sp.]|uniref:response regulator n=1 Tax=uncultured Maribacter sp. TaxID=431308 RepID=UPI0030DDADA4
MPPKKLFIVHEDIDVCLLLQYILQVDFKTTVVANSFGMVENYLESQSFEVVLTDVNIDGISRNQYIAYLNDKLPDAKIVVITDMDQGIIEKELFNIGIEQFFDFPLTITELSNALKSSF